MSEFRAALSELVLKVDPAPTSETDAVIFTQPRAEPASGPVVLNASPSSSDPGF